MAEKNVTNNIIPWLPTNRTCDCQKGALNCLSERAWLRNQVPIWWFNSKELNTKFDSLSRQAHPAIFPSALAKRVIRNYTHENECVLDIFSGVGTTLFAAKLTNRNAIGFELNLAFADYTTRRLNLKHDIRGNSAHLRTNSGIHLQQICSDSRNLLEYLPSESIDLVFTSPPYWDLLKQRPSQRNLRNQKHLKKNYSTDKLDLSNDQTFDAFANNIKEIFSNVSSVLKPGSRCIVNTGDYRRKGNYISLSNLYIEVLQNLNFELKNVIIWDRRREYDIGLFSYPRNFIVNNGMFEYILEFKK